MSLPKGETNEKSWWQSEGGSQHRIKWVTRVGGIAVSEYTKTVKEEGTKTSFHIWLW